METDGQRHAYRETLLKALRERLARGPEADPGQVRVFVNRACIGALDCDRGEATLVYASQNGPVSWLELRSESGALVGSLHAQDFDTKTVRFTAGGTLFAVTVQNGPERASATVSARPAYVRSRVRPAPALATARSLAAPLAQAGLVVAVVGLLVDRGVERQALMQAMTASLEVQRQELADVHRVADDLSRELQDLRAQAGRAPEPAVSKNVAAEQRAQRLLMAELRRAADERKRLLRKIRELADKEEVTGRTLAALQVRSAEPEPKAVPPSPTPMPEPPAAPDPAPAPPPLRSSAVMPDPSAPPLMFWVSFQDGTSEESIQRLIGEIHGRKGSVDAGWYNVEVVTPNPGTPEAFLESIRKSKIVRAVSARPAPPSVR